MTLLTRCLSHTLSMSQSIHPTQLTMSGRPVGFGSWELSRVGSHRHGPAVTLAIFKVSQLPWEGRLFHRPRRLRRSSSRLVNFRGRGRLCPDRFDLGKLWFLNFTNYQEQRDCMLTAEAISRGTGSFLFAPCYLQFVHAKYLPLFLG